MSVRDTLTRALTRIGMAPGIAIGVVVSGLLVNALLPPIHKLVHDGLGITSPDGGQVATLLVVLILCLVVVIVAAMLPTARLRSPLSPHSGTDQPTKKRGLILLVSNAESALYAIEYHFLDGPLEMVWLIPSHGLGQDPAFFGPGTGKLAEEIKAKAEELARTKGRPLVVAVDTRGVSPANAQDTYDCVRQIFRQRRLPPADVIADFTGGTKPMTLGMIMACMNLERELEYVSLHVPTKKSHGPFLIDYRPDAFDLKRGSA